MMSHATSWLERHLSYLHWHLSPGLRNSSWFVVLSLLSLVHNWLLVTVWSPDTRSWHPLLWWSCHSHANWSHRPGSHHTSVRQTADCSSSPSWSPTPLYKRSAPYSSLYKRCPSTSANGDASSPHSSSCGRWHSSLSNSSRHWRAAGHWWTWTSGTSPSPAMGWLGLWCSYNSMSLASQQKQFRGGHLLSFCIVNYYNLIIFVLIFVLGG